MREIVNVISKNLLTPTDTDLSQMLKATRSQRANFAEDTGSVNTLSVAFDPPLGSYSLGLPLRVRVHDTCTGPSTIDAGAGRVPIRRTDGLALAAGDLAAGGIAGLVWDGAAFQLINFFGRGGGGGGGGDTIINNYNVNLPYTVDASTTPNIITANFSPAITALVAGTTFLVKIANTNTADTVINVNALSNKPVRVNGSPVTNGKLLPGDVQAGDVKLFVFDGTNFYIDPSPLIPSNVTLNVPSQFASPQVALDALARKTISSTAMVTILLASGIYSKFTICHHDADCITIRGTMLAAAPVLGDFARTGSGSSQRAADAASNITMLRSRYGSEIRLTGNVKGIENLGPGSPQVLDLLITGDKTTFQTGIAIDAGSPLGKTMITNNIAIWGCYWGFWGGGRFRIGGGSVTNCNTGCTCEQGGNMHITSQVYCGGNDSIGHFCRAGSTLHVQSTTCQCNGNYGVFVAGGSYSNWDGGGLSVTVNGSLDFYCSGQSAIEIKASTTPFTTLSPPNFVVGNNNSIIMAAG